MRETGEANYELRITNYELKIFMPIMRLTCIYLFFVVGGLLTVSPVLGQDAQVTASVDSDTVGVQDQFRLTIIVSGKDSDEAEAPKLSALQNFRVVSGPSISSQFQWINGRSSSSKSFIYILIPEKEGQFTIDPIEVSVGDAVHKTQQLQIRVTSAPSRPSPGPSTPQRRIRPFDPLDPFEEERTQNRVALGDAVFVRAELDRNTAFVGQQVTILYKIYTQVRITGIELQESPSLSGFWVEDLEVDKTPKGQLKVIDGREYQAFTIRKQALFPTAAGKLTIPSSLFAISASSPGDFFSIFDRSEILYRKTQELILEAKALPEKNKPADFTNAVGTFELDAKIDKEEVATGEAVALSIGLKGQGNLKMIPDISIPDLPDFAIYSSKRSDSHQASAGNRLAGEKAWEYVIVPKAPGKHAIPAIPFSYFNPDKEEYETVATPELALNVIRAMNGSAPIGLSGSEKQDLIRRGTDVNFIKLVPGSLKSQSVPFYRSYWFYLIAAVPLILNACAVVYQRRRSKLSENACHMRSRRAKRAALEKLKAAEKAGKLDPRQFYDLASTAFSGYLADKFNLAEIELTGDTLERMLSEKSISVETMEEIKSCLEECDFGRFVSAANSTDKMRELSDRIRKNIGRLEKSNVSGSSR
jgi:hypothetical protein